jgi:hypothetical protein
MSENPALSPTEHCMFSDGVSNVQTSENAGVAHIIIAPISGRNIKASGVKSQKTNTL